MNCCGMTRWFCQVKVKSVETADGVVLALAAGLGDATLHDVDYLGKR